VATALFVMAMTGVTYAHLTGNRLYYILQAKLAASDQSRIMLARLNDEIRTGKRVLVGTGTVSSFTAATNGTAQMGNAVMIYPGTNTNSFITYYRDSSLAQLRRRVNNSTNFEVVAQFVTNATVFSATHYDGSVVTNSVNNRVIRVELLFSQIVIPRVLIGQGELYETYRLRSSVTRRALE
jgi:hypothetical protein